MINISSGKLVIGNGFDLYCGLKTKYEDFFNYEKKIYDQCRRFLDDTLNAGSYRMVSDRQIKNLKLHLENRETFDSHECTFWNLYFYLRNIKENRLWCDIEREILNGLTDENSIINAAINVINSFLENNEIIMEIDESFVLAKYYLLDNKKINQIINKEDYYRYLLKEIKRYELKFGEYVNKQLIENEDEYIRMAETIFYKLNKNNTILSLDSFNYTKIEDIGDKILDFKIDLVKHINGDCFNPIFGIDSSLLNEIDEKFIFTKSNRRLELLIDNKLIFDQNDLLFYDLVIFGHSLNVQDYNYFFPLLDTMDLYDITKHSKIVLLYYVYDKEKEYEIRTYLINSLSKMLDAYEDYNGQTHKKRLLDKLIMQGRLLVIDIKKIK